MGRSIMTNRTKECWRHMVKRCNDPRHHKYHLYGARGIKVCPSWLSYENFRADMGKLPVGKTIGRINNDGDYEPANCRWETPWQQAQNRRTKGLQHNNKSGIAGVRWVPQKERWQATTSAGNQLYWGKDFFEACCARKSWEANR